MKKPGLILLALGLFLTIISSGQNALTFKIANPRIMYYTASGGSGVPIDGEYLDFDVQVQAQEAHSFYGGQVSFSFNSTSLFNAPGGWIITKGTILSGVNTGLAQKYDIEASNVVSGEYIVGFAGNVAALNGTFHVNDWHTISTTDFETLFNVKVYRNGSISGAAGIDFVPSNMNGEFSYVTAPSTTTAYDNPNTYSTSNLTNTYLGRIYSDTYGWSQTGGTTNNVQFVDWTAAVNTSVWDGGATIPTTGESKMGALRIHDPGVLVVLPTGQLTCTNAEINSSSGLGIISSPSATGSFIDNGTTTLVGTGAVVVQRDMTADQYHIISPPVTDQDITFFNFITSADKIRDYGEGLGGWSPSLLTSGSFNSGNGYLYFRTAAHQASKGVAYFFGTPASGDQSISITRTGNGWNCIGNPFTSAILATGGGNLLALNSAQLDPSFAGLYVWDEQPGYDGSQINYRVICNTPYTFPNGVSQLSQDIQVGQGFLVKSKTGGGSISIPKSIRSHQNTTAFKSAIVSWPAIKLIAKGANQSGSTVIAFNNNMTKGLDPTYDAGLLKGNPDFALYSRLLEENGVDFAVQSLPDRDYDTYIIPIGIDCNNGGEVTFTAETVNLPAGVQVTLQDKLKKTNTRLDLRNAAYTTTIEQGTKGTGRFFLITDDKLIGSNTFGQEDNLLNINDLHPDDLKIYTIGKTIYIQGEVSSDARFALYSIDGKLLYNFKAGWSNLNQLDASNFPSRTYILTVTEKNKRRSAKFILGE